MHELLDVDIIKELPVTKIQYVKCVANTSKHRTAQFTVLDSGLTKEAITPHCQFFIFFIFCYINRLEALNYWLTQ